MQVRINPSYKIQIWIAILISLWLVAFLVLIAPFDVAELPFQIRLTLMPFYGVLSFIGYVLLIPIQRWIIHRQKKWTMLYEITFLLVFNIGVLLMSFVYYSSDILRGEYGLAQFATSVYYPIFFVLLSILIALRWFVFKQKNETTLAKIFLKGENKMDGLHIYFDDLVSVSSADNYVEVSYLKSGALQKTLLRNTLKNIAQDHPDLLRVHRSHLVNPAHFIEWKDTNTMILSEIEVPVTKTYKESVLARVKYP